MSDGTRTHDSRDHNPMLYQLSYAHHGPANRDVRQCTAYRQSGTTYDGSGSGVGVATAGCGVTSGPGGGTKIVDR